MKKKYIKLLFVFCITIILTISLIWIIKHNYRTILLYVDKNKEWLFSGIGITAVAIIASIIKRLNKSVIGIVKNVLFKLFVIRKWWYKTTITFFFGNGFDIAVGMKTHYSEFFSWYQKNNKKMPIEYERFILSQLNNKSRWNTWSDFEKDLVSLAVREDESGRLGFKDFYYEILTKLAEYIKLEEQKIDIDKILPSNIYKAFKDNFGSYYKEVKNSKNLLARYRLSDSGVQYRFVNFNYTTILDKIIKKIYNKAEIIHVHGCVLPPKS